MTAIRRWLLQPYPFEMRWLSGLRNGFGAGVFVMLFLFFFRPFGTSVLPGHETKFLLVCAAFGLVTMLITLLVNGLCLVLPRLFEEERWRLWKEILFNLFFIGCIGLGNLLLAHVLWDIPLNARTFWGWQGFTLAVGVFPTLFGVFLTQMKLQKKYGTEAARLQPHTTATAAAAIVLSGENQNEVLALDSADIVYLAAQDNYVQVFFWENSVLKNRLLRATMRKMEDALLGNAQFFRCHRTYLVNFDFVEKVTGNAQGYRLQLRGTSETIPVSRNLNEDVRARFQPISSSH